MIGCLGDYQWPDPQPIALHVGYHRYALDSLPLPAEGCDDIRERYAALGEEVGFGFDQEDADAARGYGCLLEFKQGRFWGPSSYITDAVFIADRVRLALDGYEKQLKRRQREADRQQTHDTDQPVDAVDAEKEQRKQERQRQAEAKQAATAANFELGRKLQLRYDTVKITAPLARVLALLILDREPEKLAGRGLRYAREDWQITETVERRGKQVEKARYPEGWEAAEQLYAWIGRARTAEQIIGRLLQALIAAHPPTRTPSRTAAASAGSGPVATASVRVARSRRCSIGSRSRSCLASSPSVSRTTQTSRRRPPSALTCGTAVGPTGSG